MDANLQLQRRREKRMQSEALKDMFGEKGYFVQTSKYTQKDGLVTFYKYGNRKYDENEKGRLSNKKVKKQKKAFVKARKEKQGLALNDNEKEQFDNLMREEWVMKNWMQEKHGKYTNEEILRQINRGDNSNFEKLDGVLRDYTAEKFLENHYVISQVNDRVTMNKEEIEELVDRIEADGLFFNPLLRLGLSQRARQTEDRGGVSNFRKIDNEIAKRIMVRTLSHEMTNAEKLRFDKSIRDNSPGASDQSVEELKAYQLKLEKAKRGQMAKQLMLMHLGKLKIIKDDVGAEPTVPMASVLAHCSRTMIITPNFSGDSAGENEMWDSILSHYKKVNGRTEYSNSAQINKRGSSTHSLNRRSVNKQYGKEKKKWFNFVRQTGMDVAIGGLGASGVDGRMLNQDGSCGHVYAMRKKSMPGLNGAYLFGYESDSYGHTNQLGHTHDLKATGEKASSFLCHRSDEIGEKYGGRQADISRIRKDVIIRCMNKLDEIFDSLNQENVEIISNKLAGNLMNAEEFREFLATDLGFGEQYANVISAQREAN